MKIATKTPTETSAPLTLSETIARLTKIEMGDAHAWIGNHPESAVREMLDAGLVIMDWDDRAEYLRLTERGDALLAR